jgi:hypothetical protein
MSTVRRAVSSVGRRQGYAPNTDPFAEDGRVLRKVLVMSTVRRAVAGRCRWEGRA